MKFKIIGIISEATVEPTIFIFINHAMKEKVKNILYLI
jgi:hypothetical protein